MERYVQISSAADSSRTMNLDNEPFGCSGYRLTREPASKFWKQHSRCFECSARRTTGQASIVMIGSGTTNTRFEGYVCIEMAALYVYFLGGALFSRRLDQDLNTLYCKIGISSQEQ